MRGSITLNPEPLTPAFDDSQLASLKKDLDSAKLPRPTYASNQKEYGIESKWVAETFEYWKTGGFDWKAREIRLQSLSHFTADVKDEASETGSFRIHYIAEYSQDPDAIPLLLLHGCFENGYAAQGGDIGSVLARILSAKYDSCKAININYMPMAPPDRPEPFAGLNEREIMNVKKALVFASTGRGYANMHGTRPGTIGIVVQSSPVALLAWLGEKLRDWVDDPLPRDVILELVTMWWIQETFPTSIYAYSEVRHFILFFPFKRPESVHSGAPQLTTGVGAWNRDPDLRLTKPFGFSSFEGEIASAPESWAAETGNLQWYRYNPRGGHFAALEQPEVFAENMRECFAKIWPAGR
ncbi:hypothetical protein P7C70_g778, partial [Phenoliferia sp. Uapishka_3]